MNIFDVLDKISFSKKPIEEDSLDTDNSVNPYMINRWVSMIDATAARIVNDTTNRFNFADKNDTYRLLQTILPNYSKRKIFYIKKPNAG